LQRRTAGLNTWNEGNTFHICYKVQFDWAIKYVCDQFIIKIDQNNHYYPSLHLPRDEYLFKEKNKIAVENRAFSSRMLYLSNANNLKFPTMESALNSLIYAAEVNTFCMSEMYVDKTTGNLMLEAWAEYENEENSCIKGQIDLINGDTEITDTPCVIFNNYSP
jgi:hypothetical protein